MIEKRDQIHIFSVLEALEQMKKDGIRNVIVQSTHVLNGSEHTRMQNDIEEMRERFEKIVVGAPLLSSSTDIERVAKFMVQSHQIGQDEFLLWVGHGTEHPSNATYNLINEILWKEGRQNIFLGTLKAYPSIEDVLRYLKNKNVKKIILSPFMIVAGTHTINEILGKEEDSWKSILEKEGYEVIGEQKGLGEYPELRNILIEHCIKV